MTDLTKDEIERFAKESRLIDSYAPVAYFASICRAPLVAEVERLNADMKQMGTDLSAIQEIHNQQKAKLYAELADWKARALKAEQAGAAAYWSEVIGMFEARLNHGPAAVTVSDVLALLGDCQYLASLGHPQPAAQEPFAWARPDAVDASQDFRFIKIEDFTVPLYTTPTSAVPVVEQLVEALEQSKNWHQGDKWRDDSKNRPVWESHMDTLNGAITKGQQYLKENEK